MKPFRKFLGGLYIKEENAAIPVSVSFGLLAFTLTSNLGESGKRGFAQQ